MPPAPGSLLDWHDPWHWHTKRRARCAASPCSLCSHAGEPVHKVCAEARLAAHPDDVSGGRLLNDQPRNRSNTHASHLPLEDPMSSTQRNDNHTALAYPEPPASSLWHHRRAQARPLSSEQQRRNRELLLLAQYAPRPRAPHPMETLAEAS
ncbi:hypothetical protein [Streptomyces sp. NPDC127038]|uniref:hypothetical protein n=1 Tax=Streptomyces sp. NPDC127038 TaxID=3347114 RepID=UPI00364C69A4